MLQKGASRSEILNKELLQFIWESYIYHFPFFYSIFIPTLVFQLRSDLRTLHATSLRFVTNIYRAWYNTNSIRQFSQAIIVGNIWIGDREQSHKQNWKIISRNQEKGIKKEEQNGDIQGSYFVNKYSLIRVCWKSLMGEGRRQPTPHPSQEGKTGDRRQDKWGI